MVSLFRKVIPDLIVLAIRLVRVGPRFTKFGRYWLELALFPDRKFWFWNHKKPFLFSNTSNPFDIVPKDPNYDSAIERFNKRSRIRKFGCKYLPIIADLIETNENNEKMNIEEELLVLSTFHAGKLQFH